MQNLPSLLPSIALFSDLGDGPVSVLDMCCAPGGKTNHLACILRDWGGEWKLTCVDRSKKKMSGVREMLDKAGFQNVVTLAGDSSAVLGDGTTIEPDFVPNKVNKTKKFKPESFTHILLDPPCSALGLRPRLYLPGSSDVGDFKEYQSSFLHAASGLIKKGGYVTWSTCTWNPEENEEMVAKARDEYGFEVIDVGVDHGRGGIEGCGLDERERGWVRRFDWMEGGEEGEGIGFFVAKLRKL